MIDGERKVGPMIPSEEFFSYLSKALRSLAEEREDKAERYQSALVNVWKLRDADEKAIEADSKKMAERHSAAARLQLKRIKEG